MQNLSTFSAKCLKILKNAISIWLFIIYAPKIMDFHKKLIKFCKIYKINLQKPLDKRIFICYDNKVSGMSLTAKNFLDMIESLN